MGSNSEEQMLNFIDPALRQKLDLMVRRAVWARSLPLDSVSDLHQLVSIKLLALDEQKRASINNLEHYIRKVVRNEANHLLERTDKRSDPLAELEISDRLESQRRIEAAILLREISELLEGEEQQLFSMLLSDYNDKEIALSLNISHAAARKRVSRFRHRLVELVATQRRR